MKTQKLRQILIAIFTLLATNIFASNYYAAPKPSGTEDGSINNPCSFTAGISKLSSAGDTLFLRGGIYYFSSKISINKTGTSTSRIAIMAYPGEKPILDFSGEAYGEPGISLSTTSSYLHIKGLIIRYAGDNGLINYGNYNIIENCEFYGNCDSGLQNKTGYGNLIKNCDSHDNFDYKTGGLTAADFGGNADGFADKQYTTTGTGNTYEGCRSYHNADDGWDFYQRAGNTTIQNCICYQMGPSSFNMSQNPRALGIDSAWFKQFPMTVTNADGGKDNITISSYKNYGNGNGFKLGGDYTSHNVTLTNCLSVANAVRGFDQNNNYGTMTIYNASSYLNGYNYGFSNNSGGSLIIKNSISLSSTNNNEFASQSVTSSNNSWNISGVSCTSADFSSLDTTLILTARTSDGSLDSTGFMRLVSNSDLIDAGVDVGLGHSGNAPDLGCYEYDMNQGTISSSGSTTQSIRLGSSISNVVFTWGGGATGLSILNLPNGVSQSIDQNTKTLTISGTPTSTGIYTYTVNTTGGTSSGTSVSGKIIVCNADAKKIAYFTLPDAAADTMILNKLNNNLDFLVEIKDASASTLNYDDDSLIVISPVPSTTTYKTNFLALESLNKPMLLLKPFALKTGIWEWGTAANTSLSSVTITDKTHKIFNNLTFEGANSDQLNLFSAISTNAVTGITAWTGSPSITVLGNANGASTTTNSVVEVPVGTNMNGTTTKRRFLMIGVSEASTANLTPTATQLIENSCYYLMDMDILTDAKATKASSSDIKLIQQGSTLVVESELKIKSIQLINISGILIAKSYGENTLSMEGLPMGVYIAQITDEAGNVSSKKLIKKN